MQEIAPQGSTTVNLDSNKDAKSFSSYAYTKLGTCMPPSLDYGSVLAVSRFVLAYGLKGGNIRVVLTRGAATAMLNGHPNNIVDVCIAPDPRPTGSSTVASLSGDGICRLWEVSNQDAGGELDTREMLHLKTRSNTAQRVFFHPAWAHGKHNNMVFILHEGTVTGVTLTHDIREENAVDPSKGLLIDNYVSVRMVRESKVLDMAFVMIPTSGNWRCVTAHEDGTCCIWSLGNALGEGDDDQSSVSMDSAPPLNRKDSKSSNKRMSMVNLAPLMVIKVSNTPVLTVGFVTPYMLVTGAARNCEVCLWSLDKLEKAPTSPMQKITITRSNPPLRSFRGTFVRRIVDGACTLALFESRTLDTVVFQITEKRGITNAIPIKVQYPVLSVSGDYDIERDKLVCHVVDVDSIEDLDCPSEIAFGSVTNMEVRNSIRRASKKAESVASKEEIDMPVEWNDKKSCCVVS